MSMISRSGSIVALKTGSDTNLLREQFAVSRADAKLKKGFKKRYKYIPSE